MFNTVKSKLPVEVRLSHNNGLVAALGCPEPVLDYRLDLNSIASRLSGNLQR